MKKHALHRALAILLASQLLLGSLSPALAAEAQTVGNDAPAVSMSAEKRYVPINEIETATASSFQSGYEPSKVIDGIEDNPDNCWHTPWEGEKPTFPHWLQVEFKNPKPLIH